MAQWLDDREVKTIQQKISEPGRWDLARMGRQPYQRIMFTRWRFDYVGWPSQAVQLSNTHGPSMALESDRN